MSTETPNRTNLHTEALTSSRGETPPGYKADFDRWEEQFKASNKTIVALIERFNHGEFEGKEEIFIQHCLTADLPERLDDSDDKSNWPRYPGEALDRYLADNQSWQTASLPEPLVGLLSTAQAKYNKHSASISHQIIERKAGAFALGMARARRSIVGGP